MASRIGHVNIPNDFDESDDWVALGDDVRLLFVDILTSCARRLTDGDLSPAALMRLRPSWTDRQRQKAVGRLTDAGRVRQLNNNWAVADWPDYGMTRAEVEAYRAAQATKATLGGLARADGPRGADGRYVSQPGGVEKPQPGGVEKPQPETSPVGWGKPARNQPRDQGQGQVGSTQSGGSQERGNGSSSQRPPPLPHTHSLSTGPHGKKGPTRQTTDLYRAFEELTGAKPTAKDVQWIDDLCRDFDRPVVGQAMWNDPAPRKGSLLGRVTYHLRGPVA